MIQVDVPHAASLLLEMRNTMRTIPQLPDGLRPGSPDEAYAIQDALVAAGGWDIAALKVGCTSEAAQQALGIHEPIAGRVPRGAVVSSGASVAASTFHHEAPMIECEFALRIGADVGVDDDVSELAEVHDVVDAVAPALELVDNRFVEFFGVSAESIMADNSAVSALVLGEPVSTADVDDLEELSVRLVCEGEELATGVGADVMGDPYRSLRWVLGHERRRGRGVAAGTWVITGTCTGLVPFPVGQRVEAHFAQLGSVAVTVG
mgnify:CR=1 FL=1